MKGGLKEEKQKYLPSAVSLPKWLPGQGMGQVKAWSWHAIWMPALETATQPAKPTPVLKVCSKTKSSPHRSHKPRSPPALELTRYNYAILEGEDKSPLKKRTLIKS